MTAPGHPKERPTRATFARVFVAASGLLFVLLVLLSFLCIAVWEKFHG